MKKLILAGFVAGIWMNISEFVRNELLIKNVWVSGFQDLGLIFPSEPINGAIWGVWAFIFTAVLVWLITKFSVLQSTAIAWILGFVLLWLGMWNMGVLPKGLLYWAVPWSFVEVFVAAFIGNWILRRGGSKNERVA